VCVRVRPVRMCACVRACVHVRRLHVCALARWRGVGVRWRARLCCLAPVRVFCLICVAPRTPISCDNQPALIVNGVRIEAPAAQSTRQGPVRAARGLLAGHHSREGVYPFVCFRHPDDVVTVS
jgi:hypothetical protein